MSRYSSYMDFSEAIIEQLPAIEDLENRDREFWNEIEINSPRIAQEIRDQESIQSSFSLLGVGGLRSLCVWMGLNPNQNKDDLLNSIGKYCASRMETSGCQTLILINEFLKRKRYDAIETISRILLSDEVFDLIYSSDIDQKSERFYYGLFVYVQNPHNLRLLMLFESAERAGYKRYNLIPKFEDTSGNPIEEESAEKAKRSINQGANINELDEGYINEVLDIFERRHGRGESLCFEVFSEENREYTLVFILRSYRESHIREIEEVVFGEEAELIVLRLFDDMRSIEEHSSSGIGVPIANSLAVDLLEDQNVEYLETTQITTEEDLEVFINVLEKNSDERIRLREIYLQNAPIDEAPKLIIRCNKDKNLSSPLKYLKKRDIDLLGDFLDIRNLKVAFVIPGSNGKDSYYSFTIYCHQIRPDEYFLTYSAHNIATSIRSRFEDYLRDNYNVKIIPGT